MKKVFLLITMACTLNPVSAFRIEYGNDLIISQPVNENLYIAGGNVTINAPIHGDLIIAGGTIIINDSVTNDVLAAGGKVTLNGFVGGDIRCAGGKILISKNVTGDVVVTAGTIIIDKGISIGSLLAGGGDITVDGNIDGEVRGNFGDLFLNGNIAKDIDCRGGTITVNGNIGGRSVLAARKIIIGNNAVFSNDVRYWNKQGSVDFKKSLKSGKAIYDPSISIGSGEWYYLGATTFLSLLWYIGMAFLMILIVEYLFPISMKKAADTLFNSTLKSLGFGFLFFIAVPVLALIAFITIIGLPVGVLLVFSYIGLIVLTKIIISVVAANWFNNRYNNNWNFWRLSLAAFGIFILLKLVSAAPFVGWLTLILLACVSFGGILLNINWKRQTGKISHELTAK